MRMHGVDDIPQHAPGDGYPLSALALLFCLVTAVLSARASASSEQRVASRCPTALWLLAAIAYAYLVFIFL